MTAQCRPSAAEALPAFLAFAPAPVRARHDGWSPGLQRRFVLLLATGCPPAAAARRLGRSRQSAYKLRRLQGGASFAAAWDRALAFARDARAAGHGLPPLAEGGFEMIWVPRFYRGRLVGFVPREDRQRALRTLSRLDRLASSLEEDEAARNFDLDAYLDSLRQAAGSRHR